MLPDRQERLKELLVEGESLEPAARGPWLAGLRAGDPTLAAELETLLDATTRPELRREGFTRALHDALEDVPAEPSGLPRDLGPYRLLEVIGHGGMGVVYRAEQTTPFQREVAVKALRGGWRPDELRARVAAERRALALMEHPGIARLYDAVVDEHGTPYLVMELVRGAPITDYVGARGLGTRATLELFVTACRAVQHAHQRGILHRDLKPSNLLVSVVDGRATAKVIDFGVARLTADDGAATRLTREGQVVGTLDYMSPEQATGHTTEADTRSDVYSLGVVLYELLSGKRPRDLAGLPAHEAARRIAETPPRPLREAGAARAIASDLEVIAHKALERDPARRYDGPGALADDLERFLRDEPVTARPPSAAYELRMLVRRHRVPVLAGAGAFVLLLLFGITMAVMYEGQRRERERATAEAAKAAAINRLLQSMLRSPNPSGDGANTTIREALDRNLARVALELRRQPGLLLAVEATLGETYAGLGIYAKAESLLSAALERQLELYGPGHYGEVRILVPLGQTLRAVTRLEQSESTLWRALEVDRAAGTPDTMLRVAALEALARVTRERVGAVALVESLLVEGLRLARLSRRGATEQRTLVLKGLNDYYWSIGRWREAEAVAREALDTPLGELGERDPLRLALLGGLGRVLRLQGRLAEAEAPLRLCLEIQRDALGEDHPDVARSAGNLALVLTDLGRFAEADSLVRRTEAGLVRSLGPDHIRVTMAYTLRALLLMSRDRHAEAARIMERVRRLETKAGVAELPETIYTYQYLGVALAELGRLDEAEHWTRKALTLSLRHRGWDSPRSAVAMMDFAEVHLSRNRLDSALVWLKAAREISRKAVPTSPHLSVIESTIAACEGSLRGAPATAELETHRRGLFASSSEIFRRRRALRRVVRHLEASGERSAAAPYRAALAALPR